VSKVYGQGTAGVHALADVGLPVDEGLMVAVMGPLVADLLHATEGRSVLFITNERDGVDQIVVLDHGRIAEQGSHHQLRHAGGP
jgi:ABC-type transport system involved in cytochrome bd biosynthesis fused ATPase/permease subunit